MDRRLALALLLSGLAVVVSSTLFPPTPRRAPQSEGIASVETTAVAPPAAPILDEPTTEGIATGPHIGPADTFVVQTPKAVYRFTTLGAAVVEVNLRDYRALNRDSGSVGLVRDSAALALFRLVSGRDTVPLDRTLFSVSKVNDGGAPDSLLFRATTPLGEAIVRYRFDREGYLLKVDGQVPSSVTELVVTLPQGLRSEEANLRDDRQYLAFA